MEILTHILIFLHVKNICTSQLSVEWADLVSNGIDNSDDCHIIQVLVEESLITDNSAVISGLVDNVVVMLIGSGPQAGVQTPVDGVWGQCA